MFPSFDKKVACLAVSNNVFSLCQDDKGKDAQEAAARKEGLRAKMMEKSRDGHRWALAFSHSLQNGTTGLICYHGPEDFTKSYLFVEVSKKKFKCSFFYVND